MRIDRPIYLDKMIRSRGNGFIKIITGLRRSGKSYLLKFIFHDYLLEEGIPADHIIVIDLEDKRQAEFKDPDYLFDHVDNAMKDENSYYILIDEVQEVRDFVSVLSTLNLKPNVDLFVTGSNRSFFPRTLPPSSEAGERKFQCARSHLASSFLHTMAQIGRAHV